jgi:hypothetical protein
MNQHEKTRSLFTAVAICVIATALIYKHQPFQPMAKRLAEKVVGVAK